MATIFPNLNGYTITGFSAISGSGTVPAGKAYIIFSYTVSIPPSSGYDSWFEIFG